MGPPQIDYNVLVRLRKFPTKLTNYDTLIFSKEMIEFLVKALFDLEICLAQLVTIDLVE